MSVRLQVLIDENELKEVRQLADQENLTVSAWVRRAIQNEKRERPGRVVRKKLQSIQSFSKYDFPVSDYSDMASEIESGYLKENLK